LYRRAQIADEDASRGWSDVLELAQHLVEETVAVRSPWADACRCGCWEPDHDRWRTIAMHHHFERVRKRSGCSRCEILCNGQNPNAWYEVCFFGTLAQVKVAKEAATQLSIQGYSPICYDDFAVLHMIVKMERLRLSVSPKMFRLLAMGPRLSGFSDWPWCRDPMIDLLELIQADLDVSLVLEIFDQSKCKGYVCNACDLQEGKVRVTLAGSADNLSVAKRVLQHLLTHCHHELTHPGTVHRDVVMPDGAHIEASRWGLTSSELRHIENNWGVVVFPTAASQQLSIYSVVGSERAVCAAAAYLETISCRAHQHVLRCHHSGRDAVERWGLEEDSDLPGRWTVDPIILLQAGSIRTARRREQGAPRRKRAFKAPAGSSGAERISGSRQRTVVTPIHPQQQQKALVVSARKEIAAARFIREAKRRRRQQLRLRHVGVAFAWNQWGADWEADAQSCGFC